ncbi:hypothetical protein [Comamonas badia]|uniref:hypothetical protein n=1 Tax=Comamonas badia TaxID=265291 RepID=UPI000A06D09B|nr:hypothetical protein [Comamonas badia]
MSPTTRHAHAVTDLASRRFKALKTERLLGFTLQTSPLQLLEIGCGSGGIARYFATHLTLPPSRRSPYLRWRGKGDFYDCEPLEVAQLKTLLQAIALRWHNLCLQGWRVTFDIERPHSWGNRLLRRVPDALLQSLVPIIPTLIYRLERPRP